MKKIILLMCIWSMGLTVNAQKIEELTLYLIQQDEKMQVLESELNELKNK